MYVYKLLSGGLHAKHRQDADLFTNPQNWWHLQDCVNCFTMDQSVASIGVNIPFDTYIILFNISYLHYTQ